MNEPRFSPARSDAIRSELVRLVDSAPRPTGFRRLLAGLGFFAAGAFIGVGGAAATATIWSAEPHSPEAVPVTEPTSNPGVPAPTGYLPGQPIVSLIGETAIHQVDGEERIIQLDPPEGATHLRVGLTCTTPGQTGWGFDPGGNNPISSCDDADAGSTAASMWMDFDLRDDSMYPQHDLFYVRPAADAGSIVTMQYLALVETAWGVNASGETYGVAKPGLGEPDLLAAHGIDPHGSPVVGYLRRGYADEMFPGRPQPTSPAEALELQEEREQLYPDGWDVPLYDSDGVTQIGTFHIG